MDNMQHASAGELGALCTNLAKACTKQFKLEEAQLFTQLANYFEGQRVPTGDQTLSELATLIQEDITVGYPEVTQLAKAEGDRGALRAAVWGEKVTKLLKSLLGRYEKQQDALLSHTSIHVCEICGFVYLGDQPPEICPVCKVPNFKLEKIKREAV